MISLGRAGAVRGRLLDPREGGVSEGPYASLNLGRMTGDDVERVDENRRRLCAEVGGTLERLALNRQVHSTLVHRARAGARGEPGDGLWTDEPDLPILAMTADCLPIALARDERRRAGRGRACTRAGAACSAASSPRACACSEGAVAAAIGPAIGPCCYEVGPEVAEPFAALYGPGVLRGRNLDLWTAAELALRGRGRRARSSASTSARRATPSSSSRTAGPASRAACRA